MDSSEDSKDDIKIPGYEPQPHDVLERDFQEVLEVLVGDRNLDKFRVEYEKIYRVLRKSHDNEKRVLKKCRELNAEIVANAAKVQTALRLSDEDQSTIASLKQELEKAWNLVDTSQEKESRAKETIMELKLEITNLSQMVEEGTGLCPKEEATLQELIRRKDELVGERDAQTEVIIRSRAQALEMQEKLKQTESERDELNAEVATLREENATKRAESERETRKKDRLEKEGKDLKHTLEMQQFDIKQKQSQIVQCEETVHQLEQMLQESRSSAEKMQKEYNHLNEKVLKLHHDLEEQIHTNTQLLAENSQKQVELKIKDEEICKLKVESVKSAKAKEHVDKRVRSLELERQETEQERDRMKTEIGGLEKDIERLGKQVESEKKKQDEMMRERDLLNKMKMQAEKSTERQHDLIKINQNTSRNLESEIQGYKSENQRLAKRINHLEQEKNKYSADVSEAMKKHNEVEEEIKTRDIAIVDLRQKISEEESKLKLQQNMYETIRSDRNTYSKNLIGAQDVIQEQKRKLKIFTHQIEQLKEEIGAKDLALLNEHFNHMKVQKEKDTLRAETSKLKESIEEADDRHARQKAETERLAQVLNESDQERARQRKEHDVVSNERDILGTQLVRRNEELKLLYEQLKLQQATLSKGQVQYTNRVNEIRILRIKLGDLHREQHMLKNSIANVDVLRREVHQLSRDLLQERMKAKALGEELEHPLNVHRWRKLEGSDPTTYELIRKVQTLQKRLISKTEEAVEKDFAIQEKEKLYCELKHVLARQPGPEAIEQLNTYKITLREKTKQLKAMAAEINMYQAQIDEYKYEIGRLAKDLKEMKTEYFGMKRREHIQKQKNAELDAQLKFETFAESTIIDGGFNLRTDPEQV